MIVLDTNVVSELMKPEPEPAVVDWIGAQAPLGLFTTAITRAEVLLGVLLLPEGGRREALGAAARAMFEDDFAGRVLPFGPHDADTYARIAADRQHSGRPIAHFDAQIAAIASNTGATVATRNVSDFEGAGVDIVNPWESG